MQLVVVGVSQNSSSIALRERLWVDPDALPEVVRQLRQSVAEAFVLSTCNRVELYAVCGHEATGADVLRQFLAARGGFSVNDIREASYAYGHRAVVRHALRVAAGLDSLVIGEDEILGQMRRAVDAARRVGALGAVLDRLASASLGCGKRVRSMTKLGRRPESMASIALRAAARVRGPLAGGRVVVVGAGEMAELALAKLAALGGVRVSVVNRGLETARTLATAHGAESRPWNELESAISEADVVVACTSAPLPVLSAAAVVRARSGDTGRPLLCVDLGVPRDIDPAVGTLRGVTLLDIDQLRAEADAYRDECGHESVRRAEAIVEAEAERFMEWWHARSVASTVTRLHAHAGAVADAELERALSRLPELSPRAREVVMKLATRIVGKLLREPTMALKRDPEGANMALVVERLFALAPAGDGATLGHGAPPAQHLDPHLHQEPVAT